MSDLEYDEATRQWHYTDEAMASMPADLTCSRCGNSDVPNMPENGITIEFDGETLCNDCHQSDGYGAYSVEPVDGYAGFGPY